MNRQKRTPIHNLCRMINDNDDQKALDKIALCYMMVPTLPILHAGVTSITKPIYFKKLIETMKNIHGVEKQHLVTTSLEDQFHRNLIQAAIHNVLINKNGIGREMIKILVQSYCSDNEEKITFASYRDEINRLPLHYACEMGLPWNNGLEDILNENINSLEDIDRVTSLHPFMLAASVSNYLEHCNSEIQYDISAIYQLLRKCPNILEISRQN